MYFTQSWRESSVVSEICDEEIAVFKDTVDEEWLLGIIDSGGADGSKKGKFEFAPYINSIFSSLKASHVAKIELSLRMSIYSSNNYFYKYANLKANVYALNS